MTRRACSRITLIFICLLLANAAWSAENAADRSEALGILDAWTCVRWGEDNISWVVHYPEELVEPWVRSEAAKYKLRPEQAEELRKSFSDELRIGDATAVLLSVYGYGASPVNLSPMGKNIALIDSAGNRVTPVVFEKKLDSPISGLVQGFVFFPLQKDKNFRIAVKGLVPDEETNFEFSGGARAAIATTPAPDVVNTVPDRRESSGKEVVVKIPTRRPSAPETPSVPEPVAVDEPGFGDEGETFPPTEPVVRESEKQPRSADVPVSEGTVTDAPQLAPRQVLDIYLRAWIDGDVDRMYSLLSTESQGRISKELFAREVTAGNFRNALRSGYKVSWVGDSARVTVAKKVLFVRTLETKQINFVTEGGSARVSW